LLIEFKEKSGELGLRIRANVAKWAVSLAPKGLKKFQIDKKRPP
jgi:hypothetical protein